MYVVSRNAEVAGLIIIIPRLRGHTWCWRLVTLTAEMLGCCAAVRRCSARGVAVRCRAVGEPSRSYTVKAPTEALSKLRINKDTMLNGRLDIVSRHEIETLVCNDHNQRVVLLAKSPIKPPFNKEKAHVDRRGLFWPLCNFAKVH